MSELKTLLHSFFSSKDKTINEHKDTILKEKHVTIFNDNINSIYECIDDLNKSHIEKIKENYMNIAEIIDNYTSDEVKKLEELLVEEIDSIKDENLEDHSLALDIMFNQLNNALKESGLPELLVEEIVYEDELDEEFENLESIENELSEEDDIEIEGSQEEIEQVDGNDEQLENKLTAREIGFNEGRKQFSKLGEDGLNAKSLTNQIVESEHSTKPFKWVEQWIQGFNEGLKFQEKVMNDI